MFITKRQRMKDNVESLLEPIRRLHLQISRAVVTACENAAAEDLARVDRESEGDTIYAIDSVSEELLIGYIEREITIHAPVVLIAEGLPPDGIVLPRSEMESNAVWRIIIDPIDGTRGLMYQKRSGWILTGVAPNRGADTGLQDILLAVQTEIPLIKQYLYDSLWAIKDRGATAERINRLTTERSPIKFSPSTSKSIEHGFASMSRFFPGAGAELTAIEDETIASALGATEQGKARCFEDQYISSGGQLYELMAGHDRFIADLRPLSGKNGLCSHPYDLCTELIARELGVIVTDASGSTLKARLDTETDVVWVGYANRDIRDQIEPFLQAALANRGHLNHKN
jgi:fructose-1,6-bisphosphatase/inositol monophosphatase family enzyme